MGQQQLLVLVFGIVSAGALVTGGAYAVQKQDARYNRPLVIQEALEVVADLQAWKQKPALFEGGAGLPGFGSVTFKTLGYPHTLLSNRVYKTDHGCYILQTVEAEQHAEVIFFAPSCARSDFVARVVITGSGPADLNWLQTPPPTFIIFQ